MKISAYYLKARLFPTILTVIPLLVFLNTIVAKYYNDILKEVSIVLPLISGLGLSAALLFLMVQINRFVAKEAFQRFYFQDEIQMPTTNHLLWKNTFFDSSVKEKIRSKIQQKFNIILLTVDEEDLDELKSRKQIVTAVSQIRNCLRDNKLLLQHNIEYGFFRNFLGGCLIATVISIVILLYGLVKIESAVINTGIVLTVVYLIPILFSNPIIKRFGNYYSKVLYEQFLSIK